MQIKVNVGKMLAFTYINPIKERQVIMRTRAERRKNDINKSLRKKKICEDHYGFEYYDNLHQYSKNKIHCSCPMCSSKTKDKGRKHSEELRILSMNEKEENYNE